MAGMDVKYETVGWREGFDNQGVSAKTASRLMEGKSLTRIVNESSAESHPLHLFFEWDDDEAAHEFRVIQAKQLKSNLIVTTSGKKTRRTSSHITARRRQPTLSVHSPEDLLDDRKQLLAAATSELLAVKRKYGQLDELADIFEMIDRLESAVLCDAPTPAEIKSRAAAVRGGWSQEAV